MVGVGVLDQSHHLRAAGPECQRDEVSPLAIGEYHDDGYLCYIQGFKEIAFVLCLNTE